MSIIHAHQAIVAAVLALIGPLALLFVHHPTALQQHVHQRCGDFPRCVPWGVVDVDQHIFPGENVQRGRLAGQQPHLGGCGLSVQDGDRPGLSFGRNKQGAGTAFQFQHLEK
jgi:hypothetical protein